MEEKIFSARIDDLKERVQRTGKPQFFGFLSEGEAAVANAALKNGSEKYSFFGGYKEALRTFLCVYPDFCDDISFPITSITAEFRKQDKLTHRDFLGSLTALGITREKIGDILVEDARAVFFVEKTISRFVLEQVSKVGKVGVKLKEGCDLPLPCLNKKIECSATVASNRLDCIVSALVNTSRNGALETIGQSLVSVNSFVCEKPTQKINSGDRISVRKKGRFDIISIGDISKKGRIILRYEKYL